MLDGQAKHGDAVAIPIEHFSILRKRFSGTGEER
jgi:hypothetical protein